MIKLNPNDEQVKEVRKALKENDGYCPCAIFKNEDTKCMCKDFRDRIAYGIEGKCHCGLYEFIGGQNG
jgi:ferredoxin-thioredoxin reductase catalytic subunit